LKGEENDLLWVYSILKHPIRMKILEILAGKETVSFTELKNTLNIGTGKIYYHLDALGPLIMQNEKRQYLLSKDGKRVYSFITSSKDKLSTLAITEPRWNKLTRGFFLALFPKSYFAFLMDRPLIQLTSAICLVVLGGWIAMMASLNPTILFLTFTPTPSINIITLFIEGWLGLFILSELLSTLIFRRTKNHLGLFVSSAHAFIPLIIFSIIHAVNRYYPFGFTGPVAYLCLILAQIWALCLLAAAISLSKELKIDKSLLLSLLIFYLNVVILHLTY